MGIYSFDDQSENDAMPSSFNLKNLAINLNFNNADLEGWTNWIVPNLMAYLVVFISFKCLMIAGFKGKGECALMSVFRKTNM